MQAAMEVGTFASESVARLLERLAYQINTTTHTPDADAVHDLRVAIRRFAQALVLFRQVFSGKESKKIRRRLKDLMDLTNEVRDCDIALELLKESELPGAVALLEQTRQRRKDAVRLLLPALRRWTARKSSAKWRSALTPDGGSHTPLEEVARHRLPRIAKRFLKDADRAASSTELHHARIEGKKLRYSLELFEPVYHKVVNDAVERLKDVQSALGKINDFRAVRDLVKELGGDEEIEAWLKKRQRKKASEFRKSWAETSDAVRESIALLKHPPAKPAARSAAAAKAATHA